MILTINGKNYAYPDLVKAYKRGLELVKTGKRHLNIYYVNETERNDTVLHISDLGYAYDLCPRQLWLKLNSAERREKHYGEDIMFMRGDIIHIETAKILQYGLDDYWTIKGIEVPVVLRICSYPIVGRTDMILRGQKGEKIIVDFKTSRGGNFKYLDAEGPGEEKKAQVRGYIGATAADYGILFFIDREGQNGIRQFYVERDNDRLRDDFAKIKKIKEKEPEVLKPRLNVKINKGDNSIYLNHPWQCDYCDYLDVSCPGALPKEYRDIKGIVAKEDKEGNLYPYEEKYRPLIDLIKELKGDE